MESWLSKHTAFLLLFFIKLFLVILELPVSLCANDLYSSCSNLFNCGKITNVGYPFWGNGRPDACGHPDLKLNCANDVATIEIMNLTYRVLDVNQSTKILEIVREDYLGGICSPRLENTTLNPDLFYYGPGYSNITLVYGCPMTYILPGQPTCAINGFMNTGVMVEIGAQGPGFCSASVVFPVDCRPYSNFSALVRNLAQIEAAIKKGFEVKWEEDTVACIACTVSKGVCGFDLITKSRTTCYCPDQSSGLTCSSSPAGSPQVPSTETGSSNVDQLVIGIPIGVVGIVVLCLVIICSVKRGHLSSNSTAWWKRSAKDYHFKAEEIIANFGSMAPKRYTYSDVKKLTKSFKDKVGQGGFGVVYKGKLPDGRIVAVKVLSNSKDNGEEFINEVASISRTSHVNIVSLLGFCYERSKRALIYEFVPNGSLDSFIYNKRTLDNIANCHLENKTMFQIAVGIARGLEYLHSGCRTRILHFDIKPHNILLDEKFCPKISDFGLAKLCKTRDQSVVSMTGTRGTIGYIAPEVFSRTFGGVSHKSDVYSYGMLVLEMVGGRKDVEGGISCTSEKYFPHGIYEKLEQDETLGNFDVTRDEEDIIKKMIIISLWCIQTNPSDRPSIGKVIEMLEGSTLQSLQLPPKPFLNSPPRPVPVLDSSTTSLLSMEG